MGPKLHSSESPVFLFKCILSPIPRVMRYPFLNIVTVTHGLVVGSLFSLESISIKQQQF